jgi:uncharacterized membrane protein
MECAAAYILEVPGLIEERLSGKKGSVFHCTAAAAAAAAARTGMRTVHVIGHILRCNLVASGVFHVVSHGSYGKIQPLGGWLVLVLFCLGDEEREKSLE